MTNEIIDFVADSDVSIKQQLQIIVEQFQDAKEYGSILSIPFMNYERIFARISEIQTKKMNDLQDMDLTLMETYI